MPVPSVAVLGFVHEANTFSATASGDDLQINRDGPASPAGRASIAGVLAALGDRANVQCLGWAEARAGTGPLPTALAQQVISDLAQPLSDRAYDAALIVVHGASVDADGGAPDLQLLCHVRKALGERAPLVAINDPHGNITDAWADICDAIVAYKTTPHRDQFATGVRAANYLFGLLSGRRPRTRPLVHRLPLLLKGTLASYTEPLLIAEPPLGQLQRLARDLESAHDVADISLNAGQGSCDVDAAGMSVVANGAADDSGRRSLLGTIEESAWLLRAQLDARSLMQDVDSALRAATQGPGTTLIVDEGCEVTAGGDGSCIDLLAGLQQLGWPSAALTIPAPHELRRLERVEPASVVEVTITTVDRQPFVLRARIVSRAPSAILVRANDTEVLLTRDPLVVKTVHDYRRHGIAAEGKKIVLVSAQARGAHWPVVDPIEWRSLDTAGAGNPDPRRFSYRRIRRPIFPLDPLQAPRG